jgi:hypothetical protein
MPRSSQSFGTNPPFRVNRLRAGHATANSPQRPMGLEDIHRGKSSSASHHGNSLRFPAMHSVIPSRFVELTVWPRTDGKGRADAYWFRPYTEHLPATAYNRSQNPVAQSDHGYQIIDFSNAAAPHSTGDPRVFSVEDNRLAIRRTAPHALISFVKYHRRMGAPFPSRMDQDFRHGHTLPSILKLLVASHFCHHLLPQSCPRSRRPAKAPAASDRSRLGCWLAIPRTLARAARGLSHQEPADCR